MRIAAAHLELLRAALDAHQLAPALVAADSGDGAGVDQRGAMDLPELRRVERGDELPDRRADQRFLLRGLDAGVLFVRDRRATSCRPRGTDCGLARWTGSRRAARGPNSRQLIAAQRQKDDRA